MPSIMADSENWRRQRAEELRLHDAGPLARASRELQPVVDGVEMMRQPEEVAPSAPAVPTAVAAPAVEVLQGHSDVRRGAEPAARRYRPQSPLLSGAGGPLPPTSAPRWRSSAPRHPILIAAAASAALAGAGALGWLLRAEIPPVSPVGVTAMRAGSAPVIPRAPTAPAVSVTPSVSIRPDATPAPAKLAGSATDSTFTADAPAILPSRTAADTLPRRSRFSSAASSITKQPSPETLPVATETTLRTTSAPDSTSRFAHPAKAMALPGRNFSPSFNCRRATTSVNYAICASPELSALDRQVSQAFYRVTASVDLERHKAIDRDQTDFLNERARCNSDDCVAAVYRRRLDTLRQADASE